jgi:hypothetical protein
MKILVPLVFACFLSKYVSHFFLVAKENGNGFMCSRNGLSPFSLAGSFHKLIHIQLLDSICNWNRIGIFISATLFRV